MNPLDSALSLAARGFFVFPILPKGVGYKDRHGNLQMSDGKHPAVSGWQNWATRDEAKIRKRWARMPYNIGISTSRFMDDEALVVVDVDVKGKKRGDLAVLELDLQGFGLPVTLEHSTPSAGRHMFYRVPKALKQGADVLAVGLDIRSKGGYVVAPGSEIDGVPYLQINGHGTPEPAPQWLVDRLGVAKPRSIQVDLPGAVDPARAEERAKAYLKTAPLAVEGQAGDTTTFLVAARLKDFGCTRDQAMWLMDAHWNDRCAPPWGLEQLAEKVANAFDYGKDAPGVSAPEAQFDAVEPEDDGEEPTEAKNPIQKLNDEFAFIKRGAFVLQETTDEKGRYVTEHLSVEAFHAWFSNQPLRIGEKAKPVSKWWMESSHRRQYEGVVFCPQKDPGPRWFNLWRGFAAQPAPAASHPALDMFLEHALQNVCRGDKDLFRWLMGWFAHLIQHPSEKPLVALVFKGKKGTGKNALVERVGALLGDHFLVADNPRYLLSNFNSHLEANLFFVLDEATWAGDKTAEGRLKGLVTGARHVIERKGAEPYQVDNLTRVAILGNEDWLVPATHDERRFAVFHLGDGRLQDRAFFTAMRKGMEAGGYAHLLRYLLDFDLSTVDINEAPNTAALVEQKVQSLEPVPQWWMDCLVEGQMVGGDFGGEWPDEIPTNRVYQAFCRWAREKNIHRSRLPVNRSFGRQLSNLAPHFARKKAVKKDKGDTTYIRHSPGLERLRLDMEDFLGGPVEWE